MLTQPLPLLHRGRRRPGRGQPSGPYDRWPGACPGRQGHPGRQRRLPPSRMGGVRRHRRARRARAPGAPSRSSVRRPGRALSGIIANGAGLAMSTCDVVNQVGGRPANFLDIGGGASAEVMASALEVISSDPSVRSIFINIFGGITRGEDVANGIVTALARVDINGAHGHPPGRHQCRSGPGNPADGRVRNGYQLARHDGRRRRRAVELAGGGK